MKKFFCFLTITIFLVSNSVFAETNETIIDGGRPPNAFPTQEDLTCNEVLIKANDIINNILETEKKVTALLNQARLTKDLVKTNCISDKLLLIRTKLRIIEGLVSNISCLTINTDYIEIYKKVIIISKEINSLFNETEKCMGEEVIYEEPHI